MRRRRVRARTLSPVTKDVHRFEFTDPDLVVLMAIDRHQSPSRTDIQRELSKAGAAHTPDSWTKHTLYPNRTNEELRTQFPVLFDGR